MLKLINPCIAPTSIEPPLSLIGMDYFEYTIEDSMKSVRFKPFYTEPYFCTQSYQYSLDGKAVDMVVVGFDRDTRTFMF